MSFSHYSNTSTKYTRNGTVNTAQHYAAQPSYTQKTTKHNIASKRTFGFSPKQTSFFSTTPSSTTPNTAANVADKVVKNAAKGVKPHDGIEMFGRELWESLVTQSTRRLNHYMEIVSKSDRRAAGLENNRQIWSDMRFSPATIHDKFRYIKKIPSTERVPTLLNLWLSAADFKPVFPPRSRAVNNWLTGLILLVMAMVSAGGVTRLTRSGLSMTTWKFTGEKRPVTDSDWDEEFNLYKQSPEYKLHNSDMELKDFKFIYHMEYGHRTLGRAIGVAFALPLIGFLMSGSVSMRTGFGKALVGVLSLGGLQGLIGWWMVKSGLDEKTNVDKARVSPYRLATHLTIAFTLLVGLTVLKLRAQHGVIETWIGDKFVPKNTKNMFGFAFPRGLSHATAMVAFFTAITGAFVAGNEAGLVYNEWPEMGEGLVPGDLINPHLSLLRNTFENPTFVQFIHRNMAYTTFTLSWLTAFNVVFKQATPAPLANAAMRTAALATAQAGLGIYTLLNYVPTDAAALHQFGAMLVLMSATQTYFLAKNPVANIETITGEIQQKNFIDYLNKFEQKNLFQQANDLKANLDATLETRANETVKMFEAEAQASATNTSINTFQRAHTAQAAVAEQMLAKSTASNAAKTVTGAAQGTAASTVNKVTKINKSTAALFAIAGVSTMALPHLGLNNFVPKRQFKD